jgi:hypothetical protein
MFFSSRSQLPSILLFDALSNSSSQDSKIQPTSSPTHRKQIQICLYIFDINAILGVAFFFMHEFI